MRNYFILIGVMIFLGWRAPVFGARPGLKGKLEKDVPKKAGKIRLILVDSLAPKEKKASVYFLAPEILGAYSNPYVNGLSKGSVPSLDEFLKLGAFLRIEAKENIVQEYQINDLGLNRILVLAETKEKFGWAYVEPGVEAVKVKMEGKVPLRIFLDSPKRTFPSSVKVWLEGGGKGSEKRKALVFLSRKGDFESSFWRVLLGKSPVKDVYAYLDEPIGIIKKCKILRCGRGFKVRIPVPPCGSLVASVEVEIKDGHAFPGMLFLKSGGAKGTKGMGVYWSVITVEGKAYFPLVGLGEKYLVLARPYGFGFRRVFDEDRLFWDDVDGPGDPGETREFSISPIGFGFYLTGKLFGPEDEVLVLKKFLWRTEPFREEAGKKQDFWFHGLTDINGEFLLPVFNVEVLVPVDGGRPERPPVHLFPWEFGSVRIKDLGLNGDVWGAFIRVEIGKMCEKRVIQLGDIKLKKL